MANFQYPVKFIGITQYHHWGKSVDFGYHYSTTDPVYSIGDGTVIYTEDTHGSYGILVIIQHQNGMASLYAHLSARRVNVGDTVIMGQQIGNIGSTGSGATDPHLHFGLYSKYTDKDAYADLDAFDYLYVYPHQTISQSTLSSYGSQIKFFDAPSNPSEPLYIRYVNNCDDLGLNVRSTPNGTLVDNIGFGTPVYVYEVSGSWSRIGTNKWVYNQYLSTEEPETYIVNDIGGLNVRNKPSNSGTILRLMPYLTSVGIYARSGDWVKISPNSERWCYSAYLGGICLNPYDPE